MVNVKYDQDRKKHHHIKLKGLDKVQLVIERQANKPTAQMEEVRLGSMREVTG